jgi:hypothetical protein
MPKSYVVTLSDVEQTAMEYVSTDVDFWIQNAVHERARLATEEMVADHIKAELDAGKPVQGTKEEMVMRTKLPNAKTRNEENMKAMLATMPMEEPTSKN